jgi:hypothetical protein
MSNTIQRRAHTIGTALLIVAVFALLLVRLGDPVAGSTYTSDQSTIYQDFGGTIRNTGSGWFVLDDTGHTPDGITIGTVTSTSVRVNYPACDVVTAVVVGADDTYAKDYSAVFGASVGLTYLVITGTVKDGSDSGYLPDVWDPTTDYSGSSNIWISGRCEVSP